MSMDTSVFLHSKHQFHMKQTVAWWKILNTELLKRNTKFYNSINNMVWFLLCIVIGFQSDILESFKTGNQGHWVLQKCCKSALFSNFCKPVRIWWDCEYKRRNLAWNKKNKIYHNEIPMQVKNSSRGLVLIGLVR